MGDNHAVGHQPHNPGGATAPPGFGGLLGGIGGFPLPPPPIQPQQQQQQSTLNDNTTPVYLSGLRPKIKGQGELLTYNVGMTYFSGLLLGGIYGSMYGYITKPPGIKNNRLIFNNVINSASRYGGNTANTFAIYAIFFTGGRYLSQYVRDKNDRINDVYGMSLATLISSITNRLQVKQIIYATSIVTVFSSLVTTFRNAAAIPYEEVYQEVKPLDTSKLHEKHKLKQRRLENMQNKENPNNNTTSTTQQA